MYSTILHYVKTGELKEFKTKKDAELFALFAAETLITGGGDLVREKIAVELVHGQHFSGKHGWDGKRGKVMLEVKSETISSKNGSRFVSGRGRFNNLSWKSFKKYEEEQGYYLSVGYDEKGKLLYAIAFDMKHLLPKLKKALEDGLGSTRLELGNVGVTISATDFPDEVEVIYVPNTFILSEYSTRLRKLLINNDKTKLGSRKLSTKPYKKKKLS